MEELAQVAQLRQPQHPQNLLCLHLLQKQENEFCRKQEAGEGEGLGVSSHLSWITSNTMILAKYAVGQGLGSGVYSLLVQHRLSRSWMPGRRQAGTLAVTPDSHPASFPENHMLRPWAMADGCFQIFQGF